MPTRLAAGPEIVAIPGPTVVPERVLRAMHRPMPDIYDGELLEVTDEVFDGLQRLARSAARPFVAISNGHGPWEMALSNTLSRGDKIVVLNCGTFGRVWGEMASFNGVRVEQIDAPPGCADDPDRLAELLAADGEHEIRAVLLVHVDTGSSARNDVAAFRAAIDAAGHPALFMVDAIASLACEPFEMDGWGVDVTIAASQKGLMAPPGLGFVWAGPRALAAHRTADLRTRYWDWTARTEEGPHYLRYCGTPPVSHLYAIRESLRMIDEEGLDARIDRHRVLAGAVHAAVDAWDGLALAVGAPDERAASVTSILCDGIDAEEIRRVTRDEMGVTLGIGLGREPGTSFRIGHMGHVNAPMLLGVLGAVEAALLALGASGQRGVEAAVRSIAADLAV